MKELLRRLTLKIGRKYTIEDNWVDSTPSPNRKLDLILEYLNSKSNQALTHQEIFEGVKAKNVTFGNVVKGVEKALNEGYIIKHADLPKASYFISHDGEEFIKDGGYASYQFWQFWRDKDSFDKIHKLATIILTLFALYFAYLNLNLKGRVTKLEDKVNDLDSKVYHLNQINQEPRKITNTIQLPDSLLLQVKTNIKIK